MTSDKLIRRVLHKLKQLHESGSDFDDRIWSFDWDEKLTADDNLSNVMDEDAVLEMLTQAKVIKSRSLPNRMREEELQRLEDPRFSHLPKEQIPHIYSDWYTARPDRREYEYIRTLDGFDYDRFRRMYEAYDGLLDKDMVIGGLRIENQRPIITIEDKLYELPTLSSGLTLDIITFAYSNLGTLVGLDELRTKIKSHQLNKPQTNLKQIFKNNEFYSGACTPFAEIKPRSIFIKNKVQLNPEQVLAIQNISTN